LISKARTLPSKFKVIFKRKLITGCFSGGAERNELANKDHIAWNSAMRHLEIVAASGGNFEVLLSQNTFSVKSSQEHART
jgi:hypothetical protein